MRTSSAIDWLAALSLFGLALWLRTTNLDHFVTADEHNWIYRSGLFLNAILRGDWPATSVWLTPGVTTTWLGSISLALFYRLHQAEIGQPLIDWLVSFSRNKIDLEILVALRWSMALFTAAMTAVVYGLARRLWARPLALFGTLLLLMEPHLLSVSRIIGHDALVTMLMIAGLLAFFIGRRRFIDESDESPSLLSSTGWVMLSGVCVGLGTLSKAPALFLVPFVGLVALVDVWQDRTRLSVWTWLLPLWGVVLWLTFVIGWPAAWVAPLTKTYEVLNNAFLSSAGLEDADIQPFVTIPYLGYSYYLINGAFKLSPATMVGTGLALVGGWRVYRATSLRELARREIFWLLLFALGFGLFMSLGVKRSPRYILPAFPALAFVAAWGWLHLFRHHRPRLVALGVGGLSLLLTLAYAPYYFTYYNPLLGGGWSAPQVVRIGWGEGLDQVGRWLNQMPAAQADLLGARYTSSIFPFYEGNVISPTEPETDYVTFYIKQSQSGYPGLEILDYFEAQGALYKIELNGINYAQIYEGPGMIPVRGQAGSGPLAYRPHTLYAAIGQPLTVDLLWSAESAISRSDQLIELTLTGPENDHSLTVAASIAQLSDGPFVSRHRFSLPADLPRDTYTLQLEGDAIGQINARLSHIPPELTPLTHELAGLRLVGAQQQLEPQAFTVDLAWQAWPEAANDYTIFIQLLDEDQQRVAGIDVQPERGFTGLDRKEIMITRHQVSLPPDLQRDSYTVLVGLYYFAGEDIINVGAVPLPQKIFLE